MWLMMCSLAFAIRLTEDDLRIMLREAAPAIEAAAGRKLAELPAVQLGEPAEIIHALAGDHRRRNGRVTFEAAGKIQALGDSATAVYARSARRIYVNIPLLRELLRRAESRHTDPRPQARAALMHELAHALQDQYGGLGHTSPMLREGHATWLVDQALSGAVREQARQDAGLHLLGTPELTAELRPYVVGYAAVRSITELSGPEAVWSMLADPPDDTRLEALAALQARPDWPPPAFPAGLGIALGEPEVGASGAWWYAARLMDALRLPRVQGAGAAVWAQWHQRGLQAEAGVMLFDDDRAATATLEARRGSLRRFEVRLFFTIDQWRTRLSTRTVPGLRAGLDYDAGLTFRAVATSGATYRESWVQKGAELRVLATLGLAPRSLREPLAELAAWPATAAAPGTGSESARRALDALGTHPAADPTHLDAGWARLVVEHRVTTGMTCADAVAAWRERVRPDQAAVLDAFALGGCPTR